MSAAIAAEVQRAFLQLVVNQVVVGEIVVLLRQDDVLVRVDDLERARLRRFLGLRETVSGEVYVSLVSLGPDVVFELDEQALALRLTVQPALLGSTVLDLRSGPPPGLVHRQDPSAFLNYAASWLDFRRYSVFGEAGVSIDGNLLFSSASRTPDGTFVRGLTNLTGDDRIRLMRWVAGDQFASSGSLGASLFLGGIGVAREYGLDPYLVRYPTPALSGGVLSPSTADIYVDGILARRQPLPPGPFELQNLPVIAGSGVNRVVIRDAFGREQEIVSPFYFTTALLARGLDEYSYNLGFTRRNIATSSGDYGSLAFLGRHRLGLTDAVTAGLRLELGSSVASGGPTVAARLPFGEVELSAAASRDGDLDGEAVSLAYSFSGRPLSFGASVRALSAHYATLGLMAEDDRARWDADAFVGVQAGLRVSFTLRYARSEFRDKGSRDRASFLASIRLGDGATLFVTGSHTHQSGGGTENEIFAGLSYIFGNNTIGALSFQQRGSDSTGALELQKSLPVGSGFGYRLQGRLGEEHGFAAGVLQYQGPYGRYEVAEEITDGKNATTLSVAGGLVAIGGGLYASRPVQDAFALVRVPGVEGVRAYAEDQEVGRTNARGDLLVPNLLSYYGNRLRIADEDIPLDRSVEATETTVAPPVRGGALVTFPVRLIQGLTGSIRVEVAGELVTPAYGQLTVTAAERRFESPLGRQGEFYLENVPAGRHPAVVEHEAIQCGFTLEVPVSAAPTLDLGTVRCVAPPGSQRTP